MGGLNQINAGARRTEPPRANHMRRVSIATIAHRHDATSTFTLTRSPRLERIALIPFGPRRRDPFGLRFAPHRTI
jgi:hypothetical protein